VKVRINGSEIDYRPLQGVAHLPVAAANPCLFRDKTGMARSAVEAVTVLGAKYRSDKAKVAAYAQMAPARPKGTVDA